MLGFRVSRSPKFQSLECMCVIGTGVAIPVSPLQFLLKYPGISNYLFYLYNDVNILSFFGILS
jgi:hypothetical protein